MKKINPSNKLSNAPNDVKKFFDIEAKEKISPLMKKKMRIKRKKLTKMVTVSNQVLRKIQKTWKRINK